MGLGVIKDYSSAIVESVITQHGEEAAFHWLLREDAVDAPHYSLGDLAKLDDRLDAHLDGLRIAGDAGWKICEEQLSLEEPGEVFAAAVLAFERGDKQRIEEVVAVGAQSLDLARGVISALGWLGFEQAEPYIQRLNDSDEPIRRRMGLAATAIHRQPLGQVTEEALVRARGLRAVGELGQRVLLRHCQANFDDPDAECRFWGAWSAALLGDAKASRVLREIAEAGGPRAARAGGLAARRMEPGDAFQWQQQLAGDPSRQRLAVEVAGAIGDPVLIPWLMEQMSVPELARVAGEAFTTITGVDIAYLDLEGEWPEGFDAGPTEHPEDEEVEMDPDEDLPWPDPDLIARWWSEHRPRFSNGTRYLLGDPIVPPTLNEVLRTGRQRQRAAAALELVLREPGPPLFETRARGDRQQRLLGLR